MKKVAMIGVGKLGQDCAEVMSDAGYEVVGYDIEPRSPKFEMKGSIEEAVKDRDFIFIAAPTPHDPIYGGETPTSHLPNKDFDYTIVKNILSEVNKYVNKNQLVVLISTVLPGTVRSLLEPCITNARFIYNPYLIAMGTIKWDMVNPEMVIIGTENGNITGDAQELIDFYKVFMQNNPRYEVGTWDEAESIKIFYNTFISTKLALVNMIQDVAETNGNINVDVVTNALKKSTYRIMGPAYMTAALGDAGACHPRDNIALRWLADRLDLGYDLFDSIMTAREVQAERMALRCLKNGKNVTIIGKAYKPAVPYTSGSASMLVGYYIEKHGGNLNYYDPNTGDNDLKQDWTHVFLIGYWEEWVERIQFKDPGAVVIDPWRKITNSQHTGEIIHYGDTRKQHRYASKESTAEKMKSQVLDMLPNLKQYEQDIYLIDASIPRDTTFVLRPTEDIVNELVAAKNKGKSKFLFNAVTEALMPHVLSKIQRIAVILDGIIEDKDIFYISPTVNVETLYNKLIEKHSWDKRINFLSCHYFDYITTTYARGFEYIGGYDVRHRGKTFLCFNKVNREHRMVLLERMLANMWVNRGYYSFEGVGDFKSDVSSLNDQVFPYIKQNQELFPLRLNITDTRTNPVNIEPDDLHYHKDSYFSIVTETLFYSVNRPNQFHRPFVEDSIFFTEKTYRCFALLHPFILLARPYSLQELRKQGYKTFAPFINESYDLIEDDDQRFEAIFKEISRLMSFHGDDWQLWQQGIKDIVEHNKMHFHANRNFAITENYESLFRDRPRTTPILIQEPDIISSNTEQPVEPVKHVINRISVEDFDWVKVNSTENVKEEITEEISQELPSHKTEELPVVHGTIPEVLDWNMQTKILDNGMALTFPIHLDGGGYEIRNELHTVIKNTGKPQYDRAFEWCAGYGPLGFDLLDKKMVNTVVFSDCYSVAMDQCVDNAKENQVLNKITTYTTDKISSLPLTEKFDLVVANPPHSGDKKSFIDSLENKSCIENTCRLIVDEGYQAHQEFFANIKRYLTSNADIYITAGSNMDYFIRWAEEGGLQYVNFYPNTTSANGGIYHFTVST